MSVQHGAVVIPAYGQVHLTREIVALCLRESDVITVIVVDNAGDFPADDRVTVLRPGRNLGWLRGTNHGLEVARATGHDWLVALNNDTRLSTGFFAGLRAAVSAHRDGLVAPCYDHYITAQSSHFSGSVEAFPAEPVELEAPIIDGTCFALTGDLFDQLGALDAKHFGRRGWGAMEDYVLRLRALGGAAYVTRRAYLTHAHGSTARAVWSSYERYAYSEMRRGMRSKYGPHWRGQLEPTDQTPDSARTRMVDLLRGSVDRLGLSETAIGRRA